MTYGSTSKERSVKLSARFWVLIGIFVVLLIASLSLIFAGDVPSRDAPPVLILFRGYTNLAPRTAVVTITNAGSSAVYFVYWWFEYDGVAGFPPLVMTACPHKLAAAEALTFSIQLRIADPGGSASPNGRWQLVTVVQHDTWANRVRRTVAHWPLVGRRVSYPPRYKITSEPFPP